MSASTEKSVWASGAAYEPYVGRWSRLVAREFVAWLAIPRVPVGSILGAVQVRSARPFSTWHRLAKSRLLIHQRDTSRSHASRYEIVVSVFVLQMHKPCRKHQPAMMLSSLDSCSTSCRSRAVLWLKCN